MKNRTLLPVGLKALLMSEKMKTKAGWSDQTGRGFVCEDIESLEVVGHCCHFKFLWGNQTIAIKDLNLCETREAIKYLRTSRLEEEIAEKKKQLDRLYRN